MNWLQLKEAVRDWSNRTDLTDARLSTMLEMAQQRIFGGEDPLIVSAMKSRISNFDPLISVFVQDVVKLGRVCRYQGDALVPLQYLPEDEFARYEGQSGVPSFYVLRYPQIIVAPGTAELDVIVYTKPALMTADTDTNSVLDAYPSVYIYALLAQVGEWLRDAEMVAQYLPMLQAAKRDAIAADERQTRGGTPLVISTDQTVRA